MWLSPNLRSASNGPHPIRRGQIPLCPLRKFQLYPPLGEANRVPVSFLPRHRACRSVAPTARLPPCNVRALEIGSFFYSPKGMGKSPPVLRQRTTLGIGPVSFAPSLKGDTPRRLLSIPIREWKGGYVAVPG